MKRSETNLTILFEKFKEGDEDAFIAFYEIYINELYAYGISLGCDKETVKDVIQDVFVRLYSKEKKFSSKEHLKFFLFRSLKNQLYNIYKSKAVSTRTDISDDILKFSITTNIQDEISDREERIEIKKQVDYLVSKLTSRQKEVIYLRFMQGLEYEEISNIMGITTQATRKLVSRAIKRMRNHNILIFLLSI